ncbi:MAG: hypothetical protein M3281_07605 [Chloroflexota bacterium]|nr:hypothetical protein [Chloroflexota bacterium]
MTTWQFGHVLSDDAERMLQQLTEYLGLPPDEVIEIALQEYAARTLRTSVQEAADLVLGRREAALALDGSPALVKELASSGRIRSITTEDGDRYSREDVERVAEELAREREQSGQE